MHSICVVCVKNSQTECFNWCVCDFLTYNCQVNLFYHNLETLQSKKNKKQKHNNKNKNTTTKTLKYINSGKVAQRETKRLI